MAEFEARDHAQQVNIGGGNRGPVNMTTVYRTPSRPVVTAALRRDVRTFIGRDQELERILAEAGSERMVSILTIDGMAGIGKTALATRAAHALTPGFPDGQYFVDLHAHTPGQTPADPAEVLAGLLTGLGVDPRFLPDTLAGRRDMWRDRLADKRVLLVLDDARDHTQIEPLLPTSDGCVTLVTSRRRLIALDEALPLALEVLDPGPAAELFTTLARRTVQTPAERAGTVEIVRLCGYLPLAIVLLAGRLAHHPMWTLTGLADRFAVAADRLAELDTGDRAVRAAFTLSYLDLTRRQQLMFRRAGLHPGPDIDAYTTAVLADIPVEVARHELEALYTDHLLEETSPARYRLHDLLRAYARALTTSDSDRDNDEALDRLLDYYQHTSGAADRWLARRTNPTSGPIASLPSSSSRDFGGEIPALAWMRAERVNLLACLEHTTTHQPARMVVLTGLLAGLLERDGPWSQARQLHQRATEAADRLGDRLAHAAALDDLGTAFRRTGAHGEAVDLYRQALRIFREMGNRLGQANALQNLSSVNRLTGVYGEAADLHQQALTIFREIGNRLGQAEALNDLGMVRSYTGAYSEGDDLYRQALTIFREIGNRFGQANTLGNLGTVRAETGAFGEATDLIQQALTIFREIGDRFGQAQALKNLGFVRANTGAYGEADDLLQQALTIHREIGSRNGQAQTLNRIGTVRLATGAPDQALEMFTDALDLASDIGSRHEQARALEGAARSLEGLGDTDTALTHLREALEIYRRIGAPETNATATYLTTLGFR
ncbi:tetratricopeptide repeat protein [Nocardia sp. CA2R105]|uniref:ATP-binding protein n=1 Tax=Nocardia coffeae TaxID=2873381 RepID=UPI001CA76D8E|nr:tetratricopeptide repeat protein [Nocardia coffeae]MBY8857104.1 tetratricopeptide repeat protein [Nocardia coffeae]